MRRVDREDRQDLAAQLLGHVRGDAHHPLPATEPARTEATGQAGVLEVGRADAEDHLTAEVISQAWLGVEDFGGHRQLVAGEGDRRPVVPD